MRNTLALSIIMVVGLSACGKNEEATTSNPAPTSSAPAQPAATPAASTQPAPTSQPAEPAPQTPPTAPAAKSEPVNSAPTSPAPVATNSAAPDGAAKYKATCAACHGLNAQGQGMFPKLAGRSTDELSTLLNTYKSGKPVGPQTAMMAPIAAKLSDAEISALSGYLSGLK